VKSPDPRVFLTTDCFFNCAHWQNAGFEG